MSNDENATDRTYATYKTYWSHRSHLSALSHLRDLLKFRRGHGHHRQTGLPDQSEFLERTRRFNLRKSNRSGQFADRNQVNSAPVSFFRGRVRICRAFHPPDSDSGFLVNAMIEKKFISLLHLAQVISRGVIAHPGPARAVVSDEILPRIGSRLRLHQPVAFHAGRLAELNAASIERAHIFTRSEGLPGMQVAGLP